MRFPHNPSTPRAWRKDEDPVVHALVCTALSGLPETAVHSVHYNAGTKKLVIRLMDGEEGGSASLLAIRPDPAALLAIDQTHIAGGLRVTGVAVTMRAPQPSSSSTSGPDFLTRYFSPWNGIPEDPVNGSSHTILGPYWAHELGRMVVAQGAGAEAVEEEEEAGSTTTTMTARRRGTVVGQMASSRGGTLVVTVEEGGPGPAWVELAGEAVTVAHGTLRVPA